MLPAIPDTNPLTVPSTGLSISAMTEEAISRVTEVTLEHRKYEQLQFVTEHRLHAGMYTRTVMIPSGSVVTGVLVKIPTMLILMGDCEVYTGYETVRVTGHAALPAAAHRKQAFHAFADTTMSMIFPTAARTVAEAEAEFTDELHFLVPLTEPGRHQTTITGD